ncbi:MAG: L,D-transpeptidase family protein, partial [Oricola sp.]
MTSRRILNLFLAAAVAVPVVPAMTVPGKAQVQLHELLFGRNRAERRQPLIQEVPPAPKPIARVSSPRYYAYKADPLVTVTIASLLPAVDAAAGAALQPSLDFEATRFAEALRLAPESAMAMEKDIASALKAHYAEHPALVWSRGNNVTAGAKAVVKLLEAAAEHGLTASEYAVTLPSDGWSMDDPVGRTRELLAFDVALSARAMRYAMDIKDGAVNPNKLSGYHDFPLPRLTAAKAIEGLAAADPATWLQTLEPHQREYAALKKELAALNAMQVEEISLPDSILLKPGGSNESLPQIMKALRKKVSQETRDKHAATFAEYLDTPDYTDAIVALVEDFQSENGLKPDGVIGRNTLGKMSDVSHSSKIRRVELALERLRWHPEEFGSRHVVINQPAFTATYYVNDAVALSTRAIVGKKSNQTSFFFDQIETVVYNPYWGVPQSIIVNEMLGKLQADPSYLDRAGYEVTTASGQRVSSANVDWWSYSGKVPY